VPTFDFTTLLWWGLPLVAAPIIIHLINLLRHRRVRFAAMEFLLASQKKYRTRVLLKQLLLLLLRVAAILGVVLAMAQPRWTHALGHLLGGTRAFHVVLLDDSYSMGDRSGEAAGDPVTAFDRGRAVVERVCGELLGGGGRSEIAVGRFSRLDPARSAPVIVRTEGDTDGGDAAESDDRFEVPRQTATPETVQRVRDALARMAPSATDAGALAALEAAAELVGEEGASKAAPVVWLVTDFRAVDWDEAEETAAALRRLADAGAEIRLVDCGVGGADDAPATDAGPPRGTNLSVTALEIAGGVPAAGVVVPVEVTVRNDGPGRVRDTVVELREDGAARPGVRIEDIPPGAEVKRRFDVRFPRGGSHVVEARLGGDVLPADDARHLVLDVVDRVEVLLVDGALAEAGAPPSRAGDAFYLSAALAPGAGAPTGLAPRVEPPRALATLDLSTFDGVWLLDVERLDGPEVAALEAYARGGGGVVFFVGPRTVPDVVNRTLHRDGDGAFPVPLAGAVDLLPDPGERRPDVVVEEHPVVAVLSGQRNPLLDSVRVDRYVAVERGWEPPPQAGLRRLLSLRNGAPLLVERSFGAGTVAAVLSTAAPTWNNWARGNPSWVVVMLELESHLARSRRSAAALTVGDPIAVELQPGIDGVEVDFLVPPDGAVTHHTAMPGTGERLVARLPITETAGVYGVRWKRADGSERERLVAVNVDPEEGRLERLGRERLDAALVGVPFRYESAAAFEGGGQSLAGVSLVGPLLAILAAVMLAEQLLAWSASYHPTARRRPA